MAHLALEIVNFAGLLLLGIGFFWKDRRCHLVRTAGWILLGVYWISKVPGYLGEDDPFNAFGAGLALPIFLFLAFHEWRSHKWDEEYQPLRFVAGATFVAGMGYFLIDHVPVLSKILIDVVAHHSVGLTNMLGYNFTVGQVTADAAGNFIAPIPEAGINIILECTAIQALFVAAAFLFGCRGERWQKTKMFLIFVPVIYITNLMRNAMVIIMVYNGSATFETAHNIYGKILSLGVLVVLIVIAFVKVPGLYEDINGMFELPWRNKPGHDYLGHIGRLYDKDEKTYEDMDGPDDDELDEKQDGPDDEEKALRADEQGDGCESAEEWGGGPT